MPYFLSRLVALLLLPCLLIDPATAASLGTPPPRLARTNASNLYETQALMEPILRMLFSWDKKRTASTARSAANAIIPAAAQKSSQRGIGAMPLVTLISGFILIGMGIDLAANGSWALAYPDQAHGFLISIGHMLKNPHTIALPPLLGMAFSRRGFFDVLLQKKQQKDIGRPTTLIPSWLLRTLQLSANGAWTPQASDRLDDYLRKPADTLIYELRHVIEQASPEQLDLVWQYVGAHYPAQSNLIANVESLEEARRSGNSSHLLAWHVLQALTPSVTPQAAEVGHVLEDSPLQLTRRAANHLLLSLGHIASLSKAVTPLLLSANDLQKGFWITQPRAYKLLEQAIQHHPRLAALRQMPLERWETSIIQYSARHIQEFQQGGVSLLVDLYRLPENTLVEELAGRLFDGPNAPLRAIVDNLARLCASSELLPGVNSPMFRWLFTAMIRDVFHNDPTLVLPSRPLRGGFTLERANQVFQTVLQMPPGKWRNRLLQYAQDELENLAILSDYKKHRSLKSRETQPQIAENLEEAPMILNDLPISLLSDFYTADLDNHSLREAA